MEKNNKHNLSLIRGLEEKSSGWIIKSTTLNLEREEIADIIKNSTTEDEIRAFPNFFGKYIDNTYLEYFANKKIDGKNSIAFLGTNLIKNIPLKVFQSMNRESLKYFTPEQIGSLDNNIVEYLLNNLNENDSIIQYFTPEQIKKINPKIFNNLILKNKLHLFSNEVIEAVGDKINLYHRYSANVTADRPTIEVLKRQLDLLQQADKIKFLTPTALKTLHSSVIGYIKIDNFGKFSVEQLRALEDNIVYINKDAISLISIEKFRIFSDVALSKLTSSQISKLDSSKLNYLFHDDKIKSLKGDCIKYLTLNSLAGLDDDSLSKITSDQMGQFNLEQLSIFIDDNKLRSPLDKLISSIDPSVFGKLDAKFLENITIEQAKDITREQIRSIVENNKLQCFSEGMVSELTKKKTDIFRGANTSNIATQLDTLQTTGKIGVLSAESIVSINSREVLQNVQTKTLNTLIKTEAEIITTQRQSPSVLSSDVVDNLFEQSAFQELSISDIQFHIGEYVKNEKFSELNTFCIKMSEKNNEIVKNALKREINKHNSSGVYNKINTINLLKTLIIVENDGEEVGKNYLLLENKIKSLVNTEPDTIDGYISIVKTCSQMITENNFDINFREMLAQENLKKLDECVRTNYTISERNSLDAPLKEIYANSYLEYANVIAEKYKINQRKFEKQLSENEMMYLTKPEQIYFDCIRKAFEYKPDIASNIKSWTTPIFKTVLKSAAVYLGTRLLTRNVAAVAEVVGSAAVVNDVANEYDKKNYFLNSDSYHRRERERNGSGAKRFFKSCWRGVKSFFGYPFKLFSNEEKIGFENDNRNISNNIRSNIFKNNLVRSNFREMEMKIVEKNSRNKAVVQNELLKNNSVVGKLVKDYIKIKKEALKIKLQREMEEIYRQFPEFRRESGIAEYFSRIKNIFKGTFNGLVAGVFDAATFGIGGEVYEKMIENKTEQEKVAIESRLKSFRERVDKLNERFEKDIKGINDEEIDRMSKLNPLDREKVQNLIINQETELKLLKRQSRELLIEAQNDKLNLILLQLDDGGRKSDKKITKKIKNGLISEVKKLQDGKIDLDLISRAKNQLFDLIQYGKGISNEVLLNNANIITRKTINAVDNGTLDFKNVEDCIMPIFVMMDFYRMSDENNAVESGFEVIRGRASTKYVDMIEANRKIATQNRRLSF